MMRESRRWGQISKRALGVAGALSLVARCAPGEPFEEREGRADPIIAGTVPVASLYRNGIGTWSTTGGFCTASLIDDDWVLLAGHCLGFLDTIDNSTAVSPQFRSSAVTPSVYAGFDPARGGCPTPADPNKPCAETQRTIALGRYSQIVSGTYPGEDVLLARLGAAIPASFRPLPISPTRATSGAVTYWGMSDSNASCTTGRGTLRFRQLALPESITYACPGDSGGPRTVGAVSPFGAIDGVTSNGQVTSDVSAHAAEIASIVSAWNASGSSDISAWSGGAFCTHASSRLYYADVDANGLVDAVCHDFNTGARWVATNQSRLIRSTWTSNVPFCSGTTGGDVYVGDFNGDGASDVMCHPKSTGALTIDYSDRAAPFHDSNWWPSPSPMWWCTQPQQHMVVGDVNGDGRSDLICHDTSTGILGWQLADGSGHFNGTTAGSTPGGWCTGPDNWLYVGEFTGLDANRTATYPRARSDLFCINRVTGAMTIKFSRSPTAPYDAAIDEALTAGRPTHVSCTTNANCNAASGEVCQVGQCVERICSIPNSDLTVGDLTGDGLTDILCTYYGADGDANPRNDKVVRSAGLRAWGGVQAHAGAFTTALGWFDTGGPSLYPFNVPQGVRLRQVNAATTTITPPPNGIRAVTTR